MSNPYGNVKHHGHGTLTYARWKSMMARCYQTTHIGYKRYGGLEITVCERWHDFALFLADMGQCPGPKMTLDRKKNEFGYTPGNCRWATRVEQARNKTNNRLLSHSGETLCVSAWAERTGLAAETILKRLLRGWSVDRALTVLRDARAGRTIPYRKAAGRLLDGKLHDGYPEAQP